MKKILKIFGILIGLFIIIFSIFKIRESIDAHTEFTFSENKFILQYVDFPEENGRASKKYYYEINLEEKTVDYRKDVYYFDERVTNWFEGIFGNKKRKLEHRYHINDDTVKEIKDLFSEIIQTYDATKEVIHKETNSINPYDLFYYYSLKSNTGEYSIKDKNQINNINQILNKIKN